MTRSLVVLCALILGLSSVAEAKTFRVLKGQQRDISRFQRAVSRSTLHPRVKQKVLKTLARAEKSVVKSKADYKRVHTQVTRYGGTLVFAPAWGRSITLRYYTRNGNSRANSIEIFDNGTRSRSAFRAKQLSPQLTLMYRGRLSDGHPHNFPAKETSAFRLYTDNRQRSTGLTTKLGQSLLWSSAVSGRPLVSQLGPMMSGTAPKGLKVTRSGKVRVLDQAPPVQVEQNPY